MLIKQNKYFLQVVVLLALLLSCNAEEKQKEIIVAEVSNSKLTEKQLNQILDVDGNSTENREEIIRNWVETELLYQTAEENNLLDENNFNKIIKQSERKLAASYAITNYLKNSTDVINKEKLFKYFKTNKNNFSLLTNAYILNYISFNNEANAIKFRSATLLKNWKFANEKIKNRNSIKKNYADELVKVSEIQSKKMLRVLKELRKKETSIVIETELSNFVVVQLLDKLKKDEVPKLKYIQEEVRTIYDAQRNKELTRNYINELTTKKNVKIY